MSAALETDSDLPTGTLVTDPAEGPSAVVTCPRKLSSYQLSNSAVSQTTRYLQSTKLKWWNSLHVLVCQWNWSYCFVMHLKSTIDNRCFSVLLSRRETECQWNYKPPNMILLCDWTINKSPQPGHGLLYTSAINLGLHGHVCWTVCVKRLKCRYHLIVNWAVPGPVGKFTETS